MTHSWIQIHEQRFRFNTHRNSSFLVMKWLISGHLWRNYKGNCNRTWKAHSSEWRNTTKKTYSWVTFNFYFITKQELKELRASRTSPDTSLQRWKGIRMMERWPYTHLWPLCLVYTTCMFIKKSNLLKALWTLRIFSGDVATLNSRSVIVN